jgi:hypothetical protein
VASVEEGLSISIKCHASILFLFCSLNIISCSNNLLFCSHKKYILFPQRTNLFPQHIILFPQYIIINTNWYSLLNRSHPSYKARFPMPWDSKILINYPPQVVRCGNKIYFLWEQNNKLLEQDIILREQNKNNMLAWH